MSRSIFLRSITKSILILDHTVKCKFVYIENTQKLHTQDVTNRRVFYTTSNNAFADISTETVHSTHQCTHNIKGIMRTHKPVKYR